MCRPQEGPGRRKVTPGVHILDGGVGCDLKITRFSIWQISVVENYKVRKRNEESCHIIGSGKASLCK